MKENQTYCGVFAIIGRPNVGKSSFLNCILGQKISITSSKPQTTRQRIIGIHTEGEYQSIYVDTPGINVRNKKQTIASLINRSTNISINNAELVIFIVEGTRWMQDDERMLNKLRDNKVPVILVINKIDIIKDKKILLPHIKFISHQMEFIDIVPLSAKTGENINIVNNIVRNILPQATHYFPKDYITNQSQNFMAAEIIREKIMRFLNAEVPYSVTVKIEKFIINRFNEYFINAIILVERNGQKKIIIGNKGNKIKIISIEARKEMQKMFSVKVNLELWVKVKSGWADDKNILQSINCINNI